MKNYLREKISPGDVAYGYWSIIPSTTISEISSSAKYDFAILDLEHGSYDLEATGEVIRACEANHISPLVRVPGLDPALAQKALDLGAHGIIFPQIRDAQDAALATQLTKYAPLGQRGYNPFTRAGGYGVSDDSRNHNGFALTGVIVENKSALADIDKILKIENLELVYLGAYDMSVALGRPGDMENPDLKRFLRDCIGKIRSSGKAAGVMAQSKEQVKHFVDLGANWIALGVDSHIIGRAFAERRSLGLD